MKMPQSVKQSISPAHPGGPAGRPPDPDADLDDCIRQAEMAVIARDERLRRGVDRIGEQLRERTGRGLAVGAGVLAGGLVLSRLLRRRPAREAVRERMETARDPGDSGQAPGRAGVLAGLAGLLGAAGFSATRPHAAPAGRAGKAAAASPLVHALTLLLPMLPASVRARFPRAGFDLLMGVGLPLLSQISALMALRKKPSAGTHAPVTPMADLDLARYAGQWFEIARLPLASEKKCRSDISALYSLDPASGNLHILNRCRLADGSEQRVAGLAEMEGDSLPSQLRVTFAPPLLRLLPLVWADYWVLHVDADYRYALVGTPDRKHLWMLSRTPQLSSRARDVLSDQARAQGYDLGELIETEHRNPLAAAA